TIQVFLMLLFRYINLLVKPIFAPFVFMFGAIPGRSDTTWGWFRSYTVDVLVFPVVLFILNFAAAFRYESVAGNNDPFGVFGTGATLNGLIAIGMLIFATKVPAFLEEALNAKPSAHVDKAGAQVSDLTKKIPFVRNIS